MSDECTNPLCTKAIETDSGDTWRRTPRKFCSDHCKGDVWALRKAADLLSSLTPDKKLQILESFLSVGGARGNQHEINIENQYEINGSKQPETNVIRLYRCERWPRLRIAGKVRFRKGLFETGDPELIALVEANMAYGTQIHQLETPE